jgi:opacity protein-like surface antigen
MTRHMFLAAVLTVVSATAALASPDELYYPAGNCHPFDGASWQGGGSSGFAFASSVGGWFNYDANDPQALVCPVPYFRDVGDLKPITVRVVVDDFHHLAFTRAYLCGRGTNGGKICDTADNFPTVMGNSTIELTIQPTSETRFVWIEVLVPDNDDDNNPWTLNGVSGVLGYRVLRP